ncbi:MupG family TIM beta-alpha barrel fold protein [Bacillus sp. FJAT-27251]|uniref:MupG family TIM beta-alpha barrel fold protein n=1 Tax=Bacillus sp. FJAT-27251 TaxID=1684142 RepID=UPI0006A7BDD9|nr:MupG family TIM beta-alpha barrel fold protein [Bacillus sp. FJAT-27251]
MIGISFYLNDPKAEGRIAEAANSGVKRAFTSLHIPEEAGDLAVRAKRLLHLAKENGIEVYADVSYKTPVHLGVESLFDLKNLGVSGLRLDDFFEQEEILSLAQEFKLAVNASILFEKDIQSLLDSGLKSDQLLAWHNFYPRRETGLGEDFFRRQNELYAKFKIPVCAYVPGAGEKRGPLFEGLPTLEKHRNAEPFMAAMELLEEGVEDIYIGDPDPGGGLLDRLIKFDQEQVLTLRIESGFMKKGRYHLRPDLSRDVLRFMNTRTSEPVPPENTIARPAGTITMDNDRYGRYRGEIQITKMDLQADERVNVIGRVKSDQVPLLAYIKPGMAIELIMHGDGSSASFQ